MFCTATEDGLKKILEALRPHLPAHAMKPLEEINPFLRQALWLECRDRTPCEKERSMTDALAKALAAVRALLLPRHAHDFRYGDVVYLIDSNSPMKIVGFQQENDGPFMARCFKMSDFR